MPIEPTTHILVVRHAPSIWNDAGLWQGWADPPLSVKGELQAAQAGRRLAEGPRFDVIASSDLERALRSAILMAPDAAAPGPVEVYPELREYDVGEWSGLSHDEIERLWPGQIDRWRRGELLASPGGETRPAFDARIMSGLQSLARGHPGQRILTVSHGGAIRAMSRLAGNELRHIDHLAGCWLQEANGTLVMDQPVHLLGGPLPRPAAVPS